MKYVPQVFLNIRRRSTTGWNIWNVILDLTGGLLSVLQVSTEIYHCVPSVHISPADMLVVLLLYNTIYYLARIVVVHVPRKRRAGET